MKMTIRRWDTGAIIHQTEADGVRSLVESAVKKQVDLYRANLIGVNLDNANLIGANLDGAYLANVSLVGANLNRASLIGATLFNATLTGADLTYASLDGAKLHSRTLAGAKIGKYVMAGPVMQISHVSESCLAFVAYIAQDHGLRIVHDCSHFSLAEAKEQWQHRDDRRMACVALAMAESWALQQGNCEGLTYTL